ncbi:MAG TPA: hypothetical protein VGU25_17760 [Acidobacteriaceae bacterium]|nr:hypothetical protein [Acidobacteriaceae bacterium]
MLAPRGWHCFGTYGSNGESLFISPEPISTTDFFGKTRWPGLNIGIQLTISDGNTSGRFEIARTIARVFPKHMGFARAVIAEQIEPTKDFPRGPYPKDLLHHVSPELVEFTTPANQQGLGTHSWIKRARTPIEGMVQLRGGFVNASDDPFMASVYMRLPPELSPMRDEILHDVEYTDSLEFSLNLAQP